jgi:hypothetical protein
MRRPRRPRVSAQDPQKGLTSIALQGLGIVLGRGRSTVTVRTVSERGLDRTLTALKLYLAVEDPLALIREQTARVVTLEAENAALRAENAA